MWAACRLAFGAFHRFIYVPYKASTRHGVGALVKAGLAGLFTVHELTLAKADAESSPTLCHLAALFDKASAAMDSSIGQLTVVTPAARTSRAWPTISTRCNAARRLTGLPRPTGFPSNEQLASGGS